MTTLRKGSFCGLILFLCLGPFQIASSAAVINVEAVRFQQDAASVASNPETRIRIAGSEEAWGSDASKEDVWEESSDADENPWGEKDAGTGEEGSPWGEEEQAEEAPPWDEEKAADEGTPPWEEEAEEKAKAGLPIDLSGHFWTRYAHDLNEDNPFEDDDFSHTELRIKAAYDPSPAWDIVLALDADAFLYRNSGDWDHEINLQPHEAYVRYAGPFYEVTLGNQLVHWGKADEVSPLDIVNPEDLRDGFVRSREDRKLPVPMVNAKFFKGVYKVETLFIPFFQESDIDLVGRDWAFFDHYDRSVGSFRLLEDKPANDLSNSEVGVRFSGTIRNLDYAFSYFHTREDVPSFDSLVTPPGFRVPDPDAVELRDLVVFASNPLAPQPIGLRYARQNVFGIEFETTWKSLGIRGEVAYIHEKSFLNDRLRRVEVPVYSYVLGADYNKPGSFYCNLQFGQQILEEDDDGLLFTDRVTTTVNGEINKKLFDSKLELALRYLYNFTWEDYYVNPLIRLKYWTNITVDFGVEMEGGPSNSVLGFFDDNDEVYVLFQYDF
ncbi:MAG: hypothetical protein PVG49_03745 [Desulfobacteraceae bacterium]|jgi:hypothetical protein